MAIGLLTLLACLTPAIPAEEAPEHVCVVVVSPDVERSELRMDELRRIFLFRQRHWSAGRPVTILYSDSNLEPGSCLLEEIYRMDYPRMRRFILEKLYQGEIDLAPLVMTSDEAVVAAVASGKGLIGLVRRDKAAGADVQVLSINGVPPGADGYPLQR